MKPGLEQRAPPPVDVARLNLLLVGLLLTGLALYVVVQTMRGGTYALITAAILIGGVIWVVGGRRVWWLPLPIATSIGGLIWVGFRIYSHEIALLMALLALVPAVAINPKTMEQHRGRLPWTVYALLVYITIHLFGSLLINRYAHGIGMGNIVRTYTMALWPLIFVPFVFHFGASRWIRLLLILVYVGLVFRVAIGIYSYFFPGFLFFRGVNAFFLFSEYGAMELRDAPRRLLILALALFSASRGAGIKFVHLLIAIFSVWFLLLGSGRVTVAMLGVIPVLWMLVQRRLILLTLFGIFAIAVVLFVNAKPEILYELPEGPRRALTILIFEQRLDIQAQLEGSNLWHRELFRAGRERWLDSWRSFFIGNRIHPFDPDMHGFRYDFYLGIQNAAQTARYERALWTILATTGVVGGWLYLSVFLRLLGDPIRTLFRHKLRDDASVIYFIAFVHAALYLLFSPISGSFPGVELMWAGIAFAAYRDAEKRAEPPAAPGPEAHPVGSPRRVIR